MNDQQSDLATTLDRNMGFAILRVMLGINMLGRSIIRIPQIDAFTTGMAANFADTFLPEPFVLVYAYIIVITETIIGILLILGWKTRWALLTMGILLITLAFGMILQQNFGTVANILLYTFVVSFLLFHTRFDHFGLDRGFSLKK
ncbi:MAG: DoxX family membrane protein [Balneolaceae bacterium]|nr:MAG: DoxX family membrane protein [Balneolaceae bacterium]